MNRSPPSRLEWTLRIGAFMCFVGHGAFGIITKEAWVPYFAVAGIGRDSAFTLMPYVGALDIAIGCLVLWRPRPVYLAWMVLWAIWTASLRPLSGEPVWEAFERAGNYGVPAALLILGWPAGGWRAMFDEYAPRPMSPEMLRRLRAVLAATVLLLLGGHGALGVIGKVGLTDNYASVVAPATAVALTIPVGWAEIAVAAIVAVSAAPGALVVVAAWKALTEALFISAGAPVWEWVERGGSYTAPLALAMCIQLQRHKR